jgi:hypothetical protein
LTAVTVVELRGVESSLWCHLSNRSNLNRSQFWIELDSSSHVAYL